MKTRYGLNVARRLALARRAWPSFQRFIRPRVEFGRVGWAFGAKYSVMSRPRHAGLGACGAYLAMRPDEEEEARWSKLEQDQLAPVPDGALQPTRSIGRTAAADAGGLWVGD